MCAFELYGIYNGLPCKRPTLLQLVLYISIMYDIYRNIVSSHDYVSHHDNRAGSREGYSSPVGEKLTICWEIFIDDRTFIFCTNYEYLSFI